MELTKKQKKDWDRWLSKRPENVRNVAEKIVPWKWYRYKGEEDIGNRYSPRIYDEGLDGTVTLRCEKKNDECPILGGYGVFGMNPDDLEEADEF